MPFISCSFSQCKTTMHTTRIICYSKKQFSNQFLIKIIWCTINCNFVRSVYMTDYFLVIILKMIINCFNFNRITQRYWFPALCHDKQRCIVYCHIPHPYFLFAPWFEFYEIASVQIKNYIQFIEISCIYILLINLQNTYVCSVIFIFSIINSHFVEKVFKLFYIS